MWTDIPAPLYVLAGVIVTGIVSYIIAHRQRSGSIRTSEAQTLWDKFQDYNKTLAEELADLREQLHSLGEAHEELREAAMECEQRVVILTGRLRKVEVDAEAAKIIAEAMAEAEKIRHAAEGLRTDVARSESQRNPDTTPTPDSTPTTGDDGDVAAT